MSRFEKVPVPYALPGSCFICGGATKPFYVDFKTNIDFHGAIYLCSDCITEVADMCGFLSPEMTEKLKYQVERLEREVFDLTRKEAGLEVAIGGMVAAGFGEPDLPHRDNRYAVPDEKSSNESQRAENPLGNGEGTVIEPLHDEGLGELRSDDESPTKSFEFDLGSSTGNE